MSKNLSGQIRFVYGLAAIYGESNRPGYDLNGRHGGRREQKDIACISEQHLQKS